ncbi:MAG: NADH-quinone oxidoreductase subunit J [Proteobacteria bacterium]|nr:NADH-quinone oxidoreductase subunit J [Pseudomonadota bacterium]
MITAGLLMAVTFAAALLAVTLRNVLHAIFGLAVALLGIAGIFITLGSPFVAAMEVLVYVGGISVAMVFAVMLSTVVARQDEGGRRRVWAGLAALGFFAAMALVITRADFGPDSDPSEQAWAVAEIGGDLLTHYNVVFEALSLVLLIAIVGAVAISRREAAASGSARLEPGAIDPDGTGKSDVESEQRGQDA